MGGEFAMAPRSKDPQIPKAISDIVMKAMSPKIHCRYQRASDLLNDVPRGASRARR